jgi:hypothetical protein
VQAARLTQRIACLTEAPPPLAQNSRSHGAGREQKLLELILSRPWRRSSVDAQTCADIKAKLHRAISMDLPIEFSLPFGGYKSWRQPSFPHVDWAEVFWLDYLSRYAQRLCEFHPPGVHLSFTHTAGVLEWINGVTPAQESTYLGEFSQLLARRSTSSVRFGLVDHALAYGGSEAVLKLLEEREPSLPMPHPGELASARRNLRRTGPRPLSDAEDAQPHEEQVIRAARRCAALLTLERRRDFNKYGPRIQITHIRGPSLALHLGSCRSACAQPWVATGFLEWRASEQNWIECLSTDPLSLHSLLELPIEHPLRDLSPALAIFRFRTTGQPRGLKVDA